MIINLILKIMASVLIGVARVALAVLLIGFLIGMTEVIRYEARHGRRK